MIIKLPRLESNKVVEYDNWCFQHTSGNGYRWLYDDLEIDDPEVATLFKLKFQL